MPGAAAGGAPDRQLQQHRAGRDGRRRGAARPIDLGIVADRPEALAAIAPQLGRLRPAGHDRRRLGRRARSGPQRARRARPRARFLEDRDAARQAADVRPDPGVPLLGLPGNPVSAGVCAILFVRAAIRALLGLDPSLPEVPAVLGSASGGQRPPPGLPARARRLARGRPPRGASGARGRTARCWRSSRAPTCLIKRPPLAPAVAAGATVPVVLLASEPVGG